MKYLIKTLENRIIGILVLSSYISLYLTIWFTSLPISFKFLLTSLWSFTLAYFIHWGRK